MKATRFAISRSQFGRIKNLHGRHWKDEEIMRMYDISRSTYDKIIKAEKYEDYATPAPKKVKEKDNKAPVDIKIDDPRFMRGFLWGVIVTIAFFFAMVFSVAYVCEAELKAPEPVSKVLEIEGVDPVLAPSTGVLR